MDSGSESGFNRSLDPDSTSVNMDLLHLQGSQLSLSTLKSWKVLCKPWGLFLHAYALTHSWALFVEHIEKLSLSTTQEVSLASLKSFHEMVVAGEENTDKQDQARCLYIPPLTTGFPESVLRIHDTLGWIRIRIRGSMPLTNGSGSGSWIRILLFSSLTFKMPAKN